MSLKKITRSLYKWARISNDIDTLATGSPRKMLQRLYKQKVGKHVSSKFNRRQVNGKIYISSPLV